MKLILIAAVSENNVIGKDNKLIWRLPADMKFFKEKTLDHCIITGRKNYESIPEKFRPLPGRINIIVTRNKNFSDFPAVVVTSIEAAIEAAKALKETECFIIGGGEIYKQTISIADEMWITKVHAEFEGDTVFPDIDLNVWNVEERLKFTKDDKHNYNFTMFKYTRK